jgi:hypothetical protein
MGKSRKKISPKLSNHLISCPNKNPNPNCVKRLQFFFCYRFGRLLETMAEDCVLDLTECGGGELHAFNPREFHASNPREFHA